MAVFSIRLQLDPIRTLAFGSIVAGYTGIGTALTHNANSFMIQNLTDADLMFSIDGTNDHFPVVARGYFIYDIASNKTNVSGLFLAEGTRFYVKRIGVPSSGSVYVTIFYGAN